MGKGALLSVIAVAFSTLLLLYNAQLSSNETGVRENENRARLVARDLALEGRKLLLAGWVGSNGSGVAPAFTTLNQGGGQIDVVNFAVVNDTLDFTLRANYQQTVHEIRSRFAWNDFALNAMQFKVNKINPTIDPSAVLDFNSIGLDNQSLSELEQVLFTELEMSGSLADFDLGMSQQVTAMTEELDPFGIEVNEIDQAMRDAYDAINGAMYPDQIGAAVDWFATYYPAAHTSVADVNGLGGSFGMLGSNEMLTVQGGLSLTNDFQGKGILVVEGNLIVPPGVTFQWDGIILVKPPAGDTNPIIDLQGFVDIEGNLVALQDGMPNTGHMDLSIMRDMTGTWSQPYGNEMVYASLVRDHEHDYTASEGNYVVWHADDPGFPDHEGYTWFNDTLGELNANDSIFVEVTNNHNHGRGLVRFKKHSEVEEVSLIGSGFGGLYSVPGNPTRTQTFQVSDLETFDITVTRLSALKRLWDPEEDEDPHPGCVLGQDVRSGPHCVWAHYNRMEALTFAIYQRAFGLDIKLYEASLYWHRKTGQEEEDFENEMNEFISHLNDENYGLTLNIGPDVSISENPGTVFSLVSGFSGGSFGLAHLGTWTRSWDPNDAGNPATE